jgi:hypothetical protein
MTLYLLGDIELDMSHDGGQTYVDTDWCACHSDDDPGLYVHADTHALAFGPDGSTFLGGDGGVYISADHGTSWSSLSRTLDLNEIYGIALSTAKQPFAVIQGLQDNGSELLAGTSLQQWTAVQPGDGTYTGVDSANAKVLYAEQQGGGLIKSTDGGSTWQAISVPAGTTKFLTYYLADPNPSFHNRLLYNESDSLYESLDGGANWHLLDNSTNLGSANYIHSSIVQVAIAPTDENTLYAAELPRQVQATTNDGVSWRTGTGLPNRVISGVALYVGTDVGAFVSTNDGRTWTLVGKAFPHSQLTALVWRDGVLYAATYGRGLWSLQTATQKGGP